MKKGSKKISRRYKHKHNILTDDPYVFPQWVTLLFFLFVSFIIVPILSIILIAFGPRDWIQKRIWVALYFFGIFLPRCFILLSSVFYTMNVVNLFHWFILFCPFLLYFHYTSSGIVRILFTLLFITDTWLLLPSIGTISI
jgi:hypothetical protein